MRSLRAAPFTLLAVFGLAASCGDDKTIDTFCARYAKACSQNPEEEKTCIDAGHDKEAKAAAADCDGQFDDYVTCLDEAQDPCTAILPCTDELAGCNIPP